MAKYKEGDYVRFVDEELEGYVTKLVSDEVIEVTGNDGFAIPVATNMVTLVYGQFNKKDQDFDETRKKTAVITPRQFVHEGVYLALTTDIKNETATFHLVNETSYDVLISFNTEKASHLFGLFAGMLMGQQTQEIHQAKIQEISQWPVFVLRLLFHASSLQKNKPPLEKTIRIKASDLSNPKKLLNLLQENAWVFPLDKEIDRLDLDGLKEQFFSHRPKRKNN